MPYGTSNDFFWSGHCGFLMIVMLEWICNGKYLMGALTFVVNIYMAIVMVAFRIHYTIDIVIGVAIGHYWFIIF